MKAKKELLKVIDQRIEELRREKEDTNIPWLKRQKDAAIKFNKVLKLCIKLEVD